MSNRRFMRGGGMPLTAEVSLTYTEVEPVQRVSWWTLTDFIAGIEPHDVNTTVEFVPTGNAVRMLVTIDAMHDAIWTERAIAGEGMQLQKLDARLGV